MIFQTRLVEESHTVQRTTVTQGITHTAPEFKNTFSDMRVGAGASVKFDITIVGNPKPRVSGYSKRQLYHDSEIVIPWEERESQSVGAPKCGNPKKWEC